MSKKVAVTEKLRQEIRDRVTELTPGYRWHVIARRERESVEKAFLRIHLGSGRAEVFSDDAVTATIYHESVARQLTAERTIKWLEENNLWMGARLNLPEEEAPR